MYEDKKLSFKTSVMEFFFYALMAALVIGFLYFLNYLDKSTESRPKMTETFEQRLERATPQLRLLYKEVETVFASDLPKLKPDNLFHKDRIYVQVSFDIEAMNLSKQDFYQRIHSNFINRKWYIAEQTDRFIQFNHQHYGSCKIRYPRSAHKPWDVVCMMSYRRSLNQSP